MDTATVTVATGGHTYTASVDADGTVTVSRDGQWAGDGTWNGRIEDCPADLGDGAYDALDAAIREALE